MYYVSSSLSSFPVSRRKCDQEAYQDVYIRTSHLTTPHEGAPEGQLDRQHIGPLEGGILCTKRVWYMEKCLGQDFLLISPRRTGRVRSRSSSLYTEAVGLEATGVTIRSSMFESGRGMDSLP